MEKSKLIKLLTAAARPTAGVNFSDAQSAAKNALLEHFGISDTLSARNLRDHQSAIFRILEEVIDEVVPGMVQDRTGDYAEIKTIARNDKAVFRISTTEASKQRLRKAIKPGARGGIYKAYRLDSGSVTVETQVESVGYMITLEELLTGQGTVSELIALLADAWTEKIFVKVFTMLQQAAATAPAVNKVGSASADTINNNELDKLISIVKAYGRPVILGFSQHLSLLGNAVINTTSRSALDLDDIRNRGFIGTYKGTPVVEIPNYIATHNNNGIEWVFGENRIIIIPADEKPVKLVFQGDSYTAEVNQPHGGREWHNHRMMGTTVVFNNYIASYELKDNWI